VNENLNQEQQAYLLGLAREAIRRSLEGADKPRAEARSGILAQKRGVFVTLTLNGRLRGCIGYPLPVKPLAEAVIDMAVAAAIEDPRFEPLGLEELDGVKIEISVLSLPRKVKNPDEIKIGEHGLIISKGFRQGLLLPQVPVEYHWNLETYLSHGCLKAGLPEDEWKKGVNMEVFTAQVFCEKSMEEESR
jgi:AmmeMemoRadiSam system protein A